MQYFPEFWFLRRPGRVINRRKGRASCSACAINGYRIQLLPVMEHRVGVPLVRPALAGRRRIHPASIPSRVYHPRPSPPKFRCQPPYRPQQHFFSSPSLHCQSDLHHPDSPRNGARRGKKMQCLGPFLLSVLRTYQNPGIPLLSPLRSPWQSLFTSRPRSE